MRLKSKSIKRWSLIALPCYLLFNIIPVLSSPFHHRQGKILGGREVKIGEFPFIVSLELQGRHTCGGSIVNSQWVISAAHCLDPFPTLFATHGALVAGKYNLRDTNETDQTQISQLAEIVFHPEWNNEGRSVAHDLVLLKVHPPFEFTPNVSSIQMAPMDFSPNMTEMATAAGWGFIKEEGGRPKRLMAVEVPFVSDSLCRDNYKNLAGTKEIYPLIADTMICAGAEGKDSCTLDSGGPLICRGVNETQVLCGVTSWGNGCGRKDFPGVYTEISHYDKWIQETISKTKSEDEDEDEGKS